MKEKNVVLVATSTADLNREYFEKNKIVFFPNIVILNGEIILDDYSADLDKYYLEMKNGLLPTTSQNNEEVYYQKLKPIVEEGNDFVLIDISTGITHATLTAKKALERIKKEFDNVDSYVIDSLVMSVGQGLVLDRAVELRDEGKSAKEIANTIESEIQNCVGAFTVKSLDHLYRGGRVSKASMVLGKSLNICPIIKIDKQGQLILYKKVHGFKSAIKNLLTIIEEKAIGGTDYDGKIFICHSSEYENAEILRENILQKFSKVKEVNIYNINLVIGAHTGPGALGLFFWGNERL